MYPIIIVKQGKDRPKGVHTAALYGFQKCKCFYCGKYMRYMTFRPENKSRKDGYTLDHLFPRSLGFGLSGNTVLACHNCNEKKAERPPTPTEIVRAWELYAKMGRHFIARVIFP